MDTFIRQDKMDLSLVPAMIDLNEKCQRKQQNGKSSTPTLNTNEKSTTPILLLDKKITLDRLRQCSLFHRPTPKRIEFGPTRRIGVSETNEQERMMISKALKHYNRLQHLDLNF